MIPHLLGNSTHDISFKTKKIAHIDLYVRNFIEKRFKIV